MWRSNYQIVSWISYFPVEVFNILKSVTMAWLGRHNVPADFDIWPVWARINIIRCRLLFFTFLAQPCCALILLGYLQHLPGQEEIILNYVAGCSTWSDKSVKQKKRCAGAAGPTYFKSSFVTEETEEQVVSVWIDQHTDGQLNHNQLQGKLACKSQS